MRLEEEAFTQAAVVAKSKDFVWLLVNRDRTPEIPKRFNVSAYPTLLTLGRKFEKIDRFQGFRKAEEFLGDLDRALARWAKYRKGEEWDTPDPRPATLCDKARVETIAAPSDGVPAGLTMLGKHLWIGQLGKLYRVDPASGEVQVTYDLHRSVLDLCTDGKLLYAMESGWTAGKPIHVIDPADGKTVRQIVTAANREIKSHGAKGIAWRSGKLYVLEGARGRIHEIDPQTGNVTRRIQTPGVWLAGLDVDGDQFVTGSRDHLYHFDVETGELAAWLAVNYRLRSVAAHAGTLYLMEQPIFGFDKQHQRVQVWPKKTVVYRLHEPSPTTPTTGPPTKEKE